MNNTDQLLRMMEHPHHYTDQQCHEILSDPECRELYTLMAKTQSAFDLQHDLSDEEIEAEWKKLSALNTHHPSLNTQSSTPNTQPSTPTTHHPTPIKWAASFAGLLLVSGIALAAIHFANHQHPTPITQQPTITTQPSTPNTQPSSPTTHHSSPMVFDNVTLEKIVTEIAAYHHLGVEVENEQARQLRFYFVWKQEEALQTVVDQLNQFESVNILVEDNKLIVK